MSPRVVFAAIASVISGLGAAIAFKPEMVFGDNYSFAEYALSVSAVPIALIGILVIILLGLSAIPGASSAIAQVAKWKDLSFKELLREARSYGLTAFTILLIAIPLSGFEAYRLARNTFSFGRDVLFPQYRQELLTRYEYDYAVGNLYAARQGYLEYAERFKGLQSAAEAEAKTKTINRMLAVKGALLERARTKEKQYGLNRTSLHLKAEALSIHPWDSELHTEMTRDINRLMSEYLPAFLSDSQNCTETTGIALDRSRLARHIVLLGFERAQDAGIKGTNTEEFRKRICELVGGLSSERIKSLIESIWQRQAIEAALAANDPKRLSIARSSEFSSLRKVVDKWHASAKQSGESDEEAITSTDEQSDDESLLEPPKMLKDKEN